MSHTRRVSCRRVCPSQHKWQTAESRLVLATAPDCQTVSAACASHGLAGTWSPTHVCGNRSAQTTTTTTTSKCTGNYKHTLANNNNNNDDDNDNSSSSSSCSNKYTLGCWTSGRFQCSNRHRDRQADRHLFCYLEWFNGQIGHIVKSNLLGIFRFNTVQILWRLNTHTATTSSAN